LLIKSVYSESLVIQWPRENSENPRIPSVRVSTIRGLAEHPKETNGRDRVFKHTLRRRRRVRAKAKTFQRARASFPFRSRRLVTA